ncbi:MAG: DUF559 domain-containing protein [Myxococcaceae bacterium]|nr:DUF559 domain-containing protein [Myxococcaceae bacterium]
MSLSRSEQMARIRGSNTTPERDLHQALGIGTRNERIGRIRPDLVIRDDRRPIAVFVDGCFWHGCPDHYVRPRSGGDFWSNKLTENTERDSRQTKQLLRDGWQVIRLWEHEVVQDVEKAARTVRAAIDSGRSRAERWRVVEVTVIGEYMERRELRQLIKEENWRREEGPRTTAKVGRIKRTLIGEGP